MSTVRCQSGIKEKEREQNEGRLLDSQNSPGRKQTDKITQLQHILLFMKKERWVQVCRPEPEGAARIAKDYYQALNLTFLAQLDSISQLKLLRTGDPFFFPLSPFFELGHWSLLSHARLTTVFWEKITCFQVSQIHRWKGVLPLHALYLELHSYLI